MKIVPLLLAIIGVTYFTAPIIECTDNEITETINVDTYNNITTTSAEMSYEGINPIEDIIQEMQGKMYDIGAIEDKEQWFIAYKEIVDEYDDILDPPLTIYDYYTEEEIYLIQRAVETECYDQDFISKANAASVIFNRIDIGGEFGNTVEEVITKDNQFAYGRKVITESTILAVEYAASIEDTTGGCIAFRSDSKEWYDKWEYVFTDDSGHHFFRLKERK